MKTLAWLTLAASAVLLTVVATADAAARPATLVIHTVPRLEGVRVTFDGRTYVTGPSGVLSIITFKGVHSMSVLPPRSTPPTTSIRFARWLDHIVLTRRDVRLHEGLNREDLGFAVSHPVSLRLMDPSGQTIPLSRISSITITSSLGLRSTFAPRQPLANLPANHIVRKPDGLASVPVRYALQAVMMDGANVVHQGDQVFYVRPAGTWTADALVFPLRVEVRDALFGFAIGHGVKLTLPGGLTRVADLGPGHAVTIAGLPRGQYRLVPKGPGIGLSSQTALSRPQDARLLLFSWIDIAAVLLFAALFLIGLPLAGGRMVRRRGARLPGWRSRREEPAQAVAGDVSDGPSGARLAARRVPGEPRSKE